MPTAVAGDDILCGIPDDFLPQPAFLSGRVLPLQPGCQYFLGGDPGNRQGDLAIGADGVREEERTMALQVFDPTTEAKEQPIAFVPRPESLRNVRIGLVENTKYNSDKLLLRIAAILEKEYGAQSHIIRSKHGSGVPAHKEIIDEYTANCDVVIAGIGD